MSATDCDRCRELLPEVALGIADGDDRATALTHVARCRACRQGLSDLSEVVDELIDLTPDAEPPPGFETRVLGAAPLRSPRPGRPRIRLVAIAAAAVLVLFVAGLLVGRWWGEANGDGPGEPVVLAGETRDDDGTLLGHVVAVDGAPSTVLVSAAGPLPDARYRVECDYGGYSLDVGEIDVDGRAGWWSTAVDHDLDDLEEVRLVDVDDGTTYSATVEPAEG